MNIQADQTFTDNVQTVQHFGLYNQDNLDKWSFIGE